MWIQYSLIDGAQCATCSERASDDELFAFGRAQIEYEGDPTGVNVDITQMPHVTLPPVPAIAFIDDSGS